MSTITLDAKEIEKSFFKEKRLLGIAAPALPDYRFCWTLNQYLGMNFKRIIERDVQAKQYTKTDLATGLFAETRATEEDEIIYYSVYQHKILGSEHSAYLYCNHSNSTRLIPKLKELDYFLLFPDSPFIIECHHLERCSELKGVSWTKEFNLETFPGKTALIL